MPLGRAYKMRITTGQVDGNGYVAVAEDQGFYYGFWKGIHPLHGDEGYVAAGEKYYERTFQGYEHFFPRN